MAGILRVPRTRGALSGVLLVLLGAWGALIAFIGPYFHYAYSPDRAWVYNSGRLWLEILPGVGALIGGLIVLGAATRPFAVFGAWLAAMSGVWFVLGQPLSTVWTAGGTQAAGYPVGVTLTRAVEQVGFFTGLGAAVIFFAALALGRFTVVGAREALAAEDAAAAEEAAVAERPAAERASAERAAAERAATDRPAAGRPPTTSAAAERTAVRQPPAERVPPTPR